MTTTIYAIGSAAPFNEKASNAYGDFCFCCGRKLGKNVFLMHVNTAWEIIARNDEKDSQGCFPIGSTCKNKFASDAIFQYEG
jgi:hypothetical protein